MRDLICLQIITQNLAFLGGGGKITRFRKDGDPFSFKKGLSCAKVTACFHVIQACKLIYFVPDPQLHIPLDFNQLSNHPPNN